jgi:hypothetical protein
MLMQRIHLKTIRLQPRSPLVDEDQHGSHIDAVVSCGIVFQITARLAEEAMGGAKAMAGGGPFWVFVHGEVHKTAGELDEGFVKIGIRCAAGFEPQILEHIVGFVKFAGIEALKVAEETRIAPVFVLGQMRHAVSDPSTLMRHAPRVL